MTFEKFENLNGHVAVITGANGGIGRAICSRLSKLGATIHGIVRSKQQELQEFLDQLGPGHKSILGDVTDSNRLDEIASHFPKCDLLINTAGKSKIIPHNNLIALSDAEFDDLIKTNLRSVYSTIRAFMPALKASGRALVINISSASSIRTGGSNVAYAASKAGIDSLTRNFALAFAPDIRFIALNPSLIDTGFVPITTERFEHLSKITPLKRITTVEDVANAVEMFSTVMRFTTGNTFVIDGGVII